MLECEKARKFTISKENSKGEWEEITEIYRENKKEKIGKISRKCRQKIER